MTKFKETLDTIIANIKDNPNLLHDTAILVEKGQELYSKIVNLTKKKDGQKQNARGNSG